MNITAIEAATGIAWDDWLEYLGSVHAEGLSHPQIVAEVMKRLPDLDSPGWWAQGVTVAYEQTTGRRLPGQRSDGTFEPTVSRTLPGTMAEAMARWQQLVDGSTEFNGVAIDGTPATSHTDKRQHWGCRLVDGTRISADVDTYSTPLGKANLTITHQRLPAAEAAAEWKAFWKTTLEKI